MRHALKAHKLQSIQKFPFPPFKVKGNVISALNKVPRHEDVKLSLYLNKYHAMKTYWGSGGIAPRILDLGTSWR
jgi:hypothetical protein